MVEHGHTVIPIQQKPDEEDYLALQQAADVFDRMMQECGLDEEKLLQEFQAARREKGA